MGSRISTIVSEAERELVDDKGFVYKFSFLLVTIVALSTFIIMQGLESVDDLSMPFSEKVELVSLETIEREINGNSVNLAVVEEDFSDLSSLDLRGVILSSSAPKQITMPKENYVATEKVVHTGSTVQPISSKSDDKKVFISSDEGNTISFIKKKFYATNNAIFSIKLAKKFYASKKYEQALKWALITNEINAKSEESWLMFAKIKEKMGKKQDAINALNEYLRHEHSPKVTKLLQNLRESV